MVLGPRRARVYKNRAACSVWCMVRRVQSSVWLVCGSLASSRPSFQEPRRPKRVWRVSSHVWWLVWFLDLFAPVVLRTAPPVVRGVWCVVCRDVGSCVPLVDLLGPSWGLLDADWQQKVGALN